MLFVSSVHISEIFCLKSKNSRLNLHGYNKIFTIHIKINAARSEDKIQETVLTILQLNSSM